jgi:hypothetical protein
MPAQFIRRITKRTLLGLNVALNMVFLLSIWLVSFSKPVGWVTGFVGLAIPYLILLQLIFLLFWLFICHVTVDTAQLGQVRVKAFLRHLWSVPPTLITRDLSFILLSPPTSVILLHSNTL